MTTTHTAETSDEREVIVVWLKARAALFPVCGSTILALALEIKHGAHIDGDER